MKKRPSGKLKVLKAYNAGHVSLAPGDVVQVEQEFAEKLILGGFAEFEPDDEFDRAIERAHAANPEAVKRMIAWSMQRWPLVAALRWKRCAPKKSSDYMS